MEPGAAGRPQHLVAVPLFSRGQWNRILVLRSTKQFAGALHIFLG